MDKLSNRISALGIFEQNMMSMKDYIQSINCHVMQVTSFARETSENVLKVEAENGTFREMFWTLSRDLIFTNIAELTK